MHRPDARQRKEKETPKRITTLFFFKARRYRITSRGYFQGHLPLSWKDSDSTETGIEISVLLLLDILDDSHNQHSGVYGHRMVRCHCREDVRVTWSSSDPQCSHRRVSTFPFCFWLLSFCYWGSSINPCQRTSLNRGSTVFSPMELRELIIW